MALELPSPNVFIMVLAICFPSKRCSLISAYGDRNCHSSPYLQVLMILVHKFMLKGTFKIFFFLKFVALLLFLLCASFTYMGHHASCRGGRPCWPVGNHAEVGRSYPYLNGLGRQCALRGGQPAFACLPSAIGRACFCLPARGVGGGWAAQGMWEQRACSSRAALLSG